MKSCNGSPPPAPRSPEGRGRFAPPGSSITSLPATGPDPQTRPGGRRFHSPAPSLYLYLRLSGHITPPRIHRHTLVHARTRPHHQFHARRAAQMTRACQKVPPFYLEIFQENGASIPGTAGRMKSLLLMLLLSLDWDVAAPAR